MNSVYHFAHIHDYAQAMRAGLRVWGVDVVNNILYFHSYRRLSHDKGLEYTGVYPTADSDLERIERLSTRHVS